jgi:DNA-binding IclR family transcriptional regulator
LRLLRTLVAEGVVVLDPATGRYGFSPGLWLALDPFLGPARSLIAAVQDVLGRLAHQTGATATVVVPDETRRRAYPIMWAAQAPPSGFPAEVDQSLPLHTSASGQCYLAGLCEQELTEYLGTGLESTGARAAVSPAGLRRGLQIVRKQGYALGRARPATAALSMAAPLIGPDGRVGGGLELALDGKGPGTDIRLQWIALLGESAGLISHMLSDQSWSAHAAAVRLGRWQLATPWDTPDPGFGSGPAVLVRSVSRAVRLMAALVATPMGASVSELMARRHLDRSVTERLLRTLQWEGVVRREAATRRYLVNPLLWLRLSSVLRSAASLAAATAHVLEGIASDIGATACLVVLDGTGDTAVVVQHAVPPRGLCYHPVTGQRHVLHASAAGKCLLAYRSSLQVADYFKGGLRKLTETTVASPDRLARELGSVLRRGYAVSRHEAVRGLGGIALPVVAPGGKVAAGLAVVPLAEEITEASIRAWLPALRAAASSLSRVLLPNWRERFGDGPP